MDAPADVQDQTQVTDAPQVQNTPEASQQPSQQPSQTEPLPNQQRPVQAPPQPAAPQEHRSLMGDLASTIFHVFAGNPMATVDEKTGAVRPANLTSAQKFENLAHGFIRGAAAGAAQRGPGSVGRSAAAGIQVNDEAAQQQRENILKQSENVRETNAGQQRELLNKASLLKSQQDLAEGSLRIKMTNQELSKAYADNANSLSEAESVPGHEVIGTFKTADEFNKFLTDHPDTKGVAQDFAQNKIVTVPLPDGGFKAIKVPVDFVNQKTGQDFTLTQVTPTQDEKGNITYKSVQHTIPAGTVTEGQKITMLGGASQEAQKFQEFEDKRSETQSTIKEKASESAKNYAEAHKAVAETGVKGDDEMINTGRNPFNHQQLNIMNAPDTMMVDESGQPIPFKMLNAMKPSAAEVNRAQFSDSVLRLLDSVDKLQASGKLPNGPITGLTKQVLAKGGLGDEDAQKAINDISLIQSAATGAHVAGRFSVPVLDKMKGLIGLNMNDSQFKGAEESIRSVMDGYSKAGGRHTVAQWKQDHTVYAGDKPIGIDLGNGKMAPLQQ